MLPKSAEANVSKPSPSNSASRSKGRSSREGLSDTVAAAASLLEEGDLAHAGIATDARDLLLDEIEPDALQPRRHFDTAELEALAEDIGRRGVLQPILVRPPSRPGQPYRLVAGERRWRAARLAGKVRIPARIRSMSDDEVQAAQLAENVLRAELTDIEKGRALRRLYEIRKANNYKITWEDIAAEVGLGRSRIHDLFHLAELPDAVAGMIEAGRLSGSHGILLQRANDLLGTDEIIALAEQAARPDSRRTGGYLMSVSHLRQTILARQAAYEQAVIEQAVGGGVAEERDSLESASFSTPSGNSEMTGSVVMESVTQAEIKSSSSVAISPVMLHSGRFLRPAVRQVIEGLDKNTLSEVEVAAIFMALERVRNSRQLSGMTMNTKVPAATKPGTRRKTNKTKAS